METTHSRAKKGGEFGANGEWYEGGKFIATTESPKQHKRRVHGTGRVQIENGVWVAGREGFRPIYPTLGGIEIFNRTTGRFEFNANLRGDFASADSIDYRRAVITQYNDGMRWKATDSYDFTK